MRAKDEIVCDLANDSSQSIVGFHHRNWIATCHRIQSIHLLTTISTWNEKNFQIFFSLSSIQFSFFHKYWKLKFCFFFLHSQKETFLCSQWQSKQKLACKTRNKETTTAIKKNSTWNQVKCELSSLMKIRNINNSQGAQHKIIYSHKSIRYGYQPMMMSMVVQNDTHGNQCF